jgi:hypothetical protein
VATVADLRAAALACPEAVEAPHWGAPAFRVNGRIFAQVSVGDQQSGGPLRAILKLDEGRRLLLCEVEPEVFSPCVWGRFVGLHVMLDGIGADRLAGLVQDSWRRVALRRLTR